MIKSTSVRFRAWLATLANRFIVCWLLSSPGFAEAAQKTDFSRDIRPILSQHCFACHGPDDKARKAKLRLDMLETVTQSDQSNFGIIVPGNPTQSELVKRVFTNDPDELMPPPEAKKPLRDDQKRALKQWISEGAKSEAHWAFEAPVQKPLPGVRRTDWPANPIDHFVLARLENMSMSPSPRADRSTLIRRVSLDLVGLPPSPVELEHFLADPSPEAFENLVDRLLASPHYGERWARRWLDLARYADTNGYEKDRPRSIWPYRDWVINALNADMPFDQFTVEQLAGDMLPNATLQQRVATGFLRNSMLNEEGGIDPLEFRFHGVVDRVATTGTAWLGLTLGCAQCHTHKYDPIPQREYYQMMAFLNNADEPELELPQPDITKRRQEIESKIARLVADLPQHYPVETSRWQTLKPVRIETAHAETPQVLGDHSILFPQLGNEKESYRVEFTTDWPEITHLRLEALTDERLPSQGPGRTPHGNFVLSEIRVIAAPLGQTNQGAPVKLARAEADFSQDNYPVDHAIDRDLKTGWAIAGKGNWNVNRSATFGLAEPLKNPAGFHLTVTLDQQYGSHHTLGRFRLSIGQPIQDLRPLAERRQERIEERFREWMKQEQARSAQWTVLHPIEAKSNLPLLTVQPDNSIFASGDFTKSDTYEVTFESPLKSLSAIRLEALPDERLPARGPGRTDYEGPRGDFFLGEFELSADGQPVKFSRASASYARNQFGGSASAALAMDGDPQTGWTCAGRYGERHEAVFILASPLAEVPALHLTMKFGRHFASSLGRFRIAVTTNASAVARDLPAAIQELLAKSESELNPTEQGKLREAFLLITPELAAARNPVDQLRRQIPKPPTTLVLEERPAENPRPTFVHHRGEFLQTREPVEPAVLSILHPMPKDAPRTRLALARWLVSPDNPLTARVTVNREWAAFFGDGLVRTLGDFGFQGEAPSHPELLDWLAIEFMQQGWSRKKLHKLIVMSSTYQQASRLTPELLEQDPNNRWLARGSRMRLEAELVRDTLLRVSGLLSPKIGGPSVFPPQPPGITTEGTYGPLAWNVSQGEDRYRRGLYTFSKRTAPYAMFSTFDAPSGEACVARREVSNTPLQALNLLNDEVCHEAAQALGRTLAEKEAPLEEKIQSLFQRCLNRNPDVKELDQAMAFFEKQKNRLAIGELSAEQIAGSKGEAAVERAAWTTLARVILNLHEMITKG